MKIIGRVQDPELCLVLEYVEHGSLKTYLHIHKEQLTSHHLLKYALDIAQVSISCAYEPIEYYFTNLTK